MKTITTPVRGVLIAALAVMFAGVPSRADAQYFGRNKVQYGKFKFTVLATPHFDIYQYPASGDAAKEVGRMAERWHARLSQIFGHALTGRQPIMLYASHPDFEQTNVIEGELGEGTGGVTEGVRRRVVLPLAATLADTDHVLGHELVHAFQYDILGVRGSALPLWFIEGMAEYLSLGSRDAQTAMWLRDAAIEGRLPQAKDLDDPRFFPYRFGHAFWAYLAGRFGDEIIGRVMTNLMSSPEGMGAGPDAKGAIEETTNLSLEELSASWHALIRETYSVTARPRETADREATPPAAGGVVIGRETGSGAVNVGPALSPDGARVVFLSERDRLSIDVYVADTASGRILRKLVDTAADPHFESLQFLASAGSWDPKGERLALATVRAGKPVLAILDPENGRVVQEVPFEDFGEIFQPAWSPDGGQIVFSAQTSGATDLFVYDLAAGATRRLTTDAFADLQPAWSPDGARIAFVTDRFSTDLVSLKFGEMGIGVVSLSTGQVTEVMTNLAGNVVNPQWSGDGRALFVVSDAGGRRNAWRVDPSTGQSTRLTTEATGVAGITPMSPALSVAAAAPKAAISVFRDGGYEIKIVDTQATPAAEGPIARVRDAAVLPPVSRASTTVDELIHQPVIGLTETSDFLDKPYKPRFGLVGIGQQVGVASSAQFGTYVSGGVALQFSDILGSHLVGTSFGINGGAADSSFGVSYLNRAQRVNWGVFGERVPLLSGTVIQGVAEVDGLPVLVEETELFRQTYSQGGAIVAYPFSRVSRVEFVGAARHIGFTHEIRTRLFDPFSGVELDDTKQKLAVGDPLTLYDATAAYVRDTAAFGATSPVLGQRLRLETGPTVGDLKMMNVTADYRQYVMPVRPITLAGRVMHVARYGASSEEERLVPLFLGYSTLVRGYDVGSFDADECTPTTTGSCLELDRLLGSRLLVVNFEARAPLVGLFRGRLDYGPLPVELFGFFDTGTIWTRNIQPTFAGGDRPWISSAGAGVRVNLFGFAIAELNAARPFNRINQGWRFVFNLRPGF